MYRRRRSHPAPQELADVIRRHISSGELRPGERLPSIVKLAHWFGVSVPTVQAAIHVLRALGVIEVHHGVGTFVRRMSGTGPAHTFAWLNATPSELALLRAAVDREAPVVAALRIRGRRGRIPPPLRDLAFLAGERTVARHHGPEYAFRADLAFHRAILASLPGSQVLAALYEHCLQHTHAEALAEQERVRADPPMDALHERLAALVIDGRPIEAGRLARAISRREFPRAGPTLR